MKREGTAGGLRLARLLRRYEAGLYTETGLRHQLESEINLALRWLMNERHAYRALTPTPARLLHDCDQSINRARAACRRKEYREAVAGLRGACGARERLEEFRSDVAACGEAARSFRELYVLLEAEGLRGLPSVTTVAGLLDEANGLLAEDAGGGPRAAGHSRHARCLARLCSEKVSALVEVEAAGGPKAARLRERLARQMDFCTRTGDFAPTADDRKLSDALARLRDLLEAGRVVLVALLSDDLECELASRRALLAAFRHYLEVQRATDEEARAAADELRRSIATEAWGGAAARLLGRTLAAITAQGQALRPAVADIALKLDAFAPAPEPAAAEVVSHH